MSDDLLAGGPDFDDRRDPVFRFDLAEDPIADVLRGALAREAAAVQPSPDGLARIRAAIAADSPAVVHLGRRPWRQSRWTPLVAAAAAVLLIGGVGGVLATRRSTASPAAGTTVPQLPVYVPGQHDGGFRLFRELDPTDLTSPEARAQEALRIAVSGTPRDTDYTQVFAPSASGARVTARLSADRTLITVDLPHTLRLTTQTTAVATVAVQQLVWTATAATGPWNAVPDVRFTVDGVQPRRLFDLVNANRVFDRAWGGEARAPIWITSVAEGDRLGRGRQTITGVGVDDVDEVQPRVNLELRRGGVVVESTTVDLTDSERSPGHAPAPGQRGFWQFTTDLAPGAYTLTVSGVSRSDTGYTARPWSDTKNFTVG